ncbi:MAG: branched-chain amino acid aminotransferase [Pyrinomonadaceae bacterium]|jgi:4-amino-4-deoxychorismate lyase|nr:branched-chain amino acid aminotransferase [Pyrinomonadaceae bacterium]
MHALIIHNDRLLELQKARLPALTSATLYGRGVFTTLAVHRGRPFLWREHWARLVAHAERCGVRLGHFDQETTAQSLVKLIKENGVEEGRARVTLLTRAVRGVWKEKGSGGVETDLLIMTGDARPAPEDGLAITLSPYRLNTLSPLAGVKSVNYLEHVIGWEEAHARDFHEAVVLNERGEIAGATMANIFWVTRGTLHTPALITGALAGTTRARVIALAEELAFPLVEGVYDTSDLSDADEIFLTSAAHGVGLVTTYDFHRYTVSAGSVALRLREAFRQLTLRGDETT